MLGKLNAPGRSFCLKLVFGTIGTVPLLINSAFPPLYMASVTFGLRRPSARNTEAILNYASRILYGSDDPLVYRLKVRTTSRSLQMWFNIFYVITFIGSIAVTIWLMALLHFHVAHGIIFFLFLSAVSFLRFRLLQSARELEIIDRPQTLLGLMSDFFYMPFTHLGHWLSDKYRRLNLMTFLLDIAIELPLKTTLRMLRQWVGFVRDKREEI